MDFPNVSSALGIIHPICLVKGRNAVVWDESGRRYIDFVGGIGVLNLGHGHPAIVEAIKAQVDKLLHSAFNALPHRGYVSVAERLDQFVPVSYQLGCMLTNSGAEATENALKVARGVTGRQGVIAFDDAFHGRTLAALNLNGKVKPYKVGLGALPGPVYHLPFPSQDSSITAEQALAALERVFEVEIAPSEVACIFVEPIQGEGGFRLLCPEFAKALRSICDQHGIILVCDEIQSGFGRTGQRFGFTHLGIEPDLMLLGKSIASGLPLAALVGRKELMDALPIGALGGTYSGNAVACAAALAVMDVMHDDALNAWGRAQEEAIISAYQRWKSSDRFPMLGAITGVGSMRGIVFEDTVSATGAEHLSNLLTAGRNAGVLLMPSGRKRNVLRLLPPLTTEPEIMAEGLEYIELGLETLRA